MTFQLLSRGRHRKGVAAHELIARCAATVNAPVCGNCKSINLSDRYELAFGAYFICEDCGQILDVDGGRI